MSTCINTLQFVYQFSRQWAFEIFLLFSSHEYSLHETFIQYEHIFLFLLHEQLGIKLLSIELEYVYLYCCLVAMSCLTLCDPKNCSPPGSSVHGFPRQGHWVGCHFLLQGSSRPRDQTHVSCIGRWVITTGAWEAQVFTFIRNNQMAFLSACTI